MKSRISKLTAWLLTLAMLMTFIPSFTALAADTTYPYAVVDTEARTVTIDGTLGGKTEATEEDLTALVAVLKRYVESGITTIIVTGSQPAKLLMSGYLTPLTSIAFEQLTYAYNDEKTDSYWGTVDLIYQDVTEIVEYEFYVCDVLKSITLPKVTIVGDRGFWACYYLETITFGSVVTNIDDNSGEVFYDLGYKIDGCNLVLNCGQLQGATDYQPNTATKTWWNTEWKSITLTHRDSEHTTATDNGDGTHSFICTVCSNIGQSPHDWSDKNGTCKTCDYICVHGGENATYNNGICDICGEVLETIIVKYDKDKKIATVTAKQSGTYSLIFAKYGEGNRLDKIDIVEFTFEKGENTVPQEHTDFILGTGDKIMLWQDMTNLVPLCEAYIVK